VQNAANAKPQMTLIFPMLRSRIFGQTSAFVEHRPISCQSA